MAASGFHSEWVTIGRHRVLLECRTSYPDDEMRFTTQVAVETIDNNSPDARLVSVFYDDKACTFTLRIASDTSEDRHLAGVVEKVLCAMRGDANCFAEVTVVKLGQKRSDHYDHMEHLSTQARVGPLHGR